MSKAEETGWDQAIQGASLRLSGKESACSVGDLGLIPGLGRSPGGGHGNPLQYSLSGESHGQRSLVGYSPWCCKELDRTEKLSMHTHTHTFYNRKKVSLPKPIFKNLSWSEEGRNKRAKRIYDHEHFSTL